MITYKNNQTNVSEEIQKSKQKTYPLKEKEYFYKNFRNRYHNNRKRKTASKGNYWL